MGSDISRESIEIANEEARKKNIQNVKFEVQDIYAMPGDWNDAFNMIYVIDVIHDLPFPEKGVNKIWNVLSANGIFLMVDNNVHSNQADNKDNSMIQVLHTASIFHCIPVSMNTKGGEGLGAAMGVERAKGMLSNSGFDLIATAPVGKDIVLACEKR